MAGGRVYYNNIKCGVQTYFLTVQWHVAHYLIIFNASYEIKDTKLLSFVKTRPSLDTMASNFVVQRWHEGSLFHADAYAIYCCDKE